MEVSDPYSCLFVSLWHTNIWEPQYNIRLIRCDTDGHSQWTYLSVKASFLLCLVHSGLQPHIDTTSKRKQKKQTSWVKFLLIDVVHHPRRSRVSRGTFNLKTWCSGFLRFPGGITAFLGTVCNGVQRWATSIEARDTAIIDFDGTTIVWK